MRCGAALKSTSWCRAMDLSPLSGFSAIVCCASVSTEATESNAKPPRATALPEIICRRVDEALGDPSSRLSLRFAISFSLPLVSYHTGSLPGASGFAFLLLLSFFDCFAELGDGRNIGRTQRALRHVAPHGCAVHAASIDHEHIFAGAALGLRNRPAALGIAGARLRFRYRMPTLPANAHNIVVPFQDYRAPVHRLSANRRVHHLSTTLAHCDDQVSVLALHDRTQPAPVQKCLLHVLLGDLVSVRVRHRNSRIRINQNQHRARVDHIGRQQVLLLGLTFIWTLILGDYKRGAQ